MILTLKATWFRLTDNLKWLALGKMLIKDYAEYDWQSLMDQQTGKYKYLKHNIFWIITNSKTSNSAFNIHCQLFYQTCSNQELYNKIFVSRNHHWKITLWWIYLDGVVTPIHSALKGPTDTVWQRALCYSCCCFQSMTEASHYLWLSFSRRCSRHWTLVVPSKRHDQEFQSASQGVPKELRLS